MNVYSVYLDSLFETQDFDRDKYFALETDDNEYQNPSTFLLDTIHDSIMTMWGFSRSSKPNNWERDMLTDKIKAVIASPASDTYARKTARGKEAIASIFSNPRYIFQTDAFTFDGDVATLIGFSGLIDQAGASCEKWLQKNALKRGVTVNKNNKGGTVDKIFEMGGMCCYKSVMNLSDATNPKGYPVAPDTLAYTAYLECDMLLFYYFYNFADNSDDIH